MSLDAAAATEAALSGPIAGTSPAVAIADRLTIPTKLAYGIGALSDSVKTFGFTTFLLFYYTTVLGLPGAWLGLAMSVGLIWDAAIDPFIGHLSDRATVRFGRRHTFMLIGAVAAGGSFIAVFNPPAGLSSGALFAWLMVSSLILRSSNSIFMVPYYALGSEMTGDYHERTSLSGFRAGAVLVGMIVTTAASFLVYLPASTGEADAKFLGDSYASLGTTLGLVMILTGLAATFGTLHTRKRLARTSEAERSQRFGRTVVEALRNRPFRILLGSSCLSLVAAAINAALALHFLTYFAGINSNGVTAYMLSLYAGGLVGVVVWVRVSKLVEKHYVNAGTMMATAVIMSSGYWLFGDGRLFGTGAVGALAVANTFAGFFNVANTVVAQSMMADITAQDEQTGGRRRDGSFFGIYSLGQQLAAGIAILIAGVLVDRFAGLVPAQAAQSASTVERIALLSNVIPAVILFAAGLLSLRYPLRQQDFSN